MSEEAYKGVGRLCGMSEGDVRGCREAEWTLVWQAGCSARLDKLFAGGVMTVPCAECAWPTDLQDWTGGPCATMHSYASDCVCFYFTSRYSRSSFSVYFIH